ncbi:MAG: radical SAM protein [Myxococcota bacterium]|nr:radical SAM protein [Myxococcota bacterium]
MEWVGRIYRPPSEARSILLQVTVGCSWNRCTYCDMYRDKSFRPKAQDTIESDLRELADLADSGQLHVERPDRIFLCDGDALILSTAKLAAILKAIKNYLPWVERVSTYGDTRSVKKKSVQELSELHELGLKMVYHGMESGDDEVLSFIDKGGTSDEAIATADKLRQAGIMHSVMVLLGVGGQALSEQHAKNTAKVLSLMDPPFVGALTTTVVPTTPLSILQDEGRYVLPDKFQMLRELETIISESSFSNCRFSANHASNYLPLTGTLPEDKDNILLALGRIIESQNEAYLKPEHFRGL